MGSGVPPFIHGTWDYPFAHRSLGGCGQSPRAWLSLELGFPGTSCYLLGWPDTELLADGSPPIQFPSGPSFGLRALVPASLFMSEALILKGFSAFQHICTSLIKSRPALSIRCPPPFCSLWDSLPLPTYAPPLAVTTALFWLDFVPVSEGWWGTLAQSASLALYSLFRFRLLLRQENIKSQTPWVYTLLTF